jgi:hypothetical protein
MVFNPKKNNTIVGVYILFSNAAYFFNIKMIKELLAIPFRFSFSFKRIIKPHSNADTPF